MSIPYWYFQVTYLGFCISTENMLVKIADLFLVERILGLSKPREMISNYISFICPLVHQNNK